LGAVVLLAGWTLWLACSDSNDPSDGGGSGTVSKTIGPAGGTVVSSDSNLTLTIPAGALAGSRRLTVRSLAVADLGSEFDGLNVTRAYELGPDGLTFAQPVVVTMRSDQVPFLAGDTIGLRAEYLASSINGTVETLDTIVVRRDGNRLLLEGQLEHFSRIVGFRPDITGDPADFLPGFQVFAVVPVEVLVEVPFSVEFTVETGDYPFPFTAYYLDASAPQLGGPPSQYLDVPPIDPRHLSREFPYTCSAAGDWKYSASAFVTAPIPGGGGQPPVFAVVFQSLDDEIHCSATSTLFVPITGSGRVTSVPGGIDCGPPGCSARFEPGTVHLTAGADEGWKFDGWNGTAPGCIGNVTNIDIGVLTFDVNCEATFSVIPAASYTLIVDTSGTGTGNVKGGSVGDEIDCGDGGTKCAATFLAGTVVQLVATPRIGSQFVGWALDCAEFGTALLIQLTINAPKACRAVYNLLQGAGLIPRGVFPLTRRADAGVVYNAASPTVQSSTARTNGVGPLYVAARMGSGRVSAINISNPDNLIETSESGSFCDGLSSLFVETGSSLGPLLNGLSFDNRGWCYTQIPLGGQIGVIPSLGYAPGWGKQINPDYTAVANFEFSGVQLYNHNLGGNSPFVPVVSQGDRACLFELESNAAGSVVFVVGREGTAGTSTEPCNNHRTLYRIDVASATVTGAVDLGAQPRGIAVSPDGSKVYVSDFANDVVYVITNGSSLTFDRTITVGDGPVGLAVLGGGAGDRLLVTNWNSNRIQLIDLTTDQEIAGADSRGMHPVRVFVSGQNAFVLNYGDDATNTNGTVSAYGLP
jgi:YVTN family beta-propeller protein